MRMKRKMKLPLCSAKNTTYQLNNASMNGIEWDIIFQINSIKIVNFVLNAPLSMASLNIATDALLGNFHCNRDSSMGSDHKI